ncbi:hypothetical protein GA0070558_115100 [Micromonospora haikouensis]|uniref:Uncharacterized protein n=1 Tax=Micromonospora haikouensis TaxID=686309 RepID=A0A1C4WGD1_9ACTN|nr:hypothetical protein GA0070558_115100 [Micromonospora haikouensis]
MTGGRPVGRSGVAATGAPVRDAPVRDAPLPKAGDLVQVTRAASVQFVEPIRCRVVRVLDWITYDGWVWLDVYQLDGKGDAVARRSIFVRPGGLRVLRPAPAPRPDPGRRATGSGAASRRVVPNPGQRS